MCSHILRCFHGSISWCMHTEIPLKNFSTTCFMEDVLANTISSEKAFCGGSTQNIFGVRVLWCKNTFSEDMEKDKLIGQTQNIPSKPKLFRHMAATPLSVFEVKFNKISYHNLCAPVVHRPLRVWFTKWSMWCLPIQVCPVIWRTISVCNRSAKHIRKKFLWLSLCKDLNFSIFLAKPWHNALCITERHSFFSVCVRTYNKDVFHQKVWKERKQTEN